MAGSNLSYQITYNMKTKLDSSGVKQLSKLLDECSEKMSKIYYNKSSQKNSYSQVKEIEKTISTVEKLQSALRSSFDLTTGTTSATKFISSLEKAEVKADDLVRAFTNMGAQGQQAFNSLVSQMGLADAKMTSMSTSINKLLTTFQNTIRWGFSASIYETATNSLMRAVEYVQDLDQSLNDIRIVSGLSSDEMREFAEEATVAAQAIGQTTTAYTDASLIYIQQGKTLSESKELAELTLKAANVTGQETSEVSEQLTALMNGYQIQVSDMEAATDKLAAVAAATAADMEELATAESKVASTANALGVSQDQLVSQLATIVSVTRQAPKLSWAA
jgi:hypothetical protein